jgi:Cu(I)/Ag(I) efflux system membrane fusion protein
MPLSVRKKGEKEALPPGITGRVQLTPERIQLAGVKTVPAVDRPIDKQTTTVGYVAFDESRLSRIVTRVAGYVEKLYVDKTYVTVSAGEPLAEIYSPDLYSTVQELVLSLQHEATQSLAASAQDRLRLFGVSEQEIDEIVRSRKASPRLLIRSPRTGYVIEKRIVVGARVEPGMMVLEVADLSTVWIEAEVYEKDVAFLQPGQVIEARVEAVPNEVFIGRLALIYPKLETATRTNRVRFELENPDHQLRPGMFATVSIKTPLETIEPFKSRAPQTEAVFTSTGAAGRPSPVEFPVVPERAVVDTGTKKVVYVEREPGLFEGATLRHDSAERDYRV